MIPAMCRVKHDPDNEQYGDCIRAALATILDLDTEAVPHFAHDNPPAPEVVRRMREYLAPMGLTIFGVAFPGDGVSRDELLEYIGRENPEAAGLLFGRTVEDHEHVVVIQHGRVVHNPAWVGCSVVAPGEDGHWRVMVIARL